MSQFSVQPSLDLLQAVRPEEGIVDRRVFTDHGVYRKELERIFARSWLCVGHESQLPNPGDFFTTSMGEDPVIVCRQKDGSIGVFLNICRHRGMSVCRADYGNARAFTCTYHGWTYGTDGELVNTPMAESVYSTGLDRGNLGLKRVPNVAVYHGVVFANLDESAVDFQQYLSDMGYYLEALLEPRASGTVAVGGVIRWRMKGNWKLGAEQFTSDGYHAMTSHISAMMAYQMVTSDGSAPGAPVDPNDIARAFAQYASPLGHGTGFSTFSPPAGEQMRDFPQLGSYYDNLALEAAEHLGSKRWTASSGFGNVFPNFSYLGPPVRSLRVWHPRGPREMEVHAWILIDADASDEMRDAQRRFSLRQFSPAGLFEQDDGENWAQIDENLDGVGGDRVPFTYQAGLGRADDLDGFTDHVTAGFSEIGARRFYRRWLDLMTEA